MKIKYIISSILFVQSLFAANTLVNGSFESPVIGVEPPVPTHVFVTDKIVDYNDSDVSGWQTTATDHQMEFWKDGASGVPAFEGTQFIELNANQVAAVYQDIPTIPGKKFNWFVAHRGRSGTDTAVVKVGPAGGALTVQKTMVDDNTAWGTYLGSYEVPAGQTTTRLQFEAVGGGTVGNFLDGFKVGPVVQYKMDECYWLGSPNTDVYDSSLNGSDGEAMNQAKIVTDDAVIHYAGLFDGVDDYISITSIGALDFNQTMTMTLWVKPDNTSNAIILDRTHYDPNGTMDSGWNLGYFGNQVNLNIRIGGSIQIVSVSPIGWDDGRWHFIVVRYEGSALSLGVDDINASISISGEIDNAMNRPLLIASGQNTAYFPGKMDEVKIFAVALGDDEIATLKANDLAGNDYIGLPRPAVECGATIGGGTWEMLGIPADFRNSSNTKNTVADIFGDDMSGTYMTDWRVYRRDYNVTDNNSSYELLSTSDTLDFGAGYWLGSKLSSNWSENGAVSVDYNSTTNGTNECPATRCVEITNDTDLEKF